MNTTTEVSVKTCSKCSQVKTTDLFFKATQRPDGLCPQCKDCMKANAKARRERGQERLVQREWRRKSRATPAFRASRLLADAKQRKPENFTLTLEWAQEKIERGYCEATGLKFDCSGNGAPARPYAPSLDRTDPSKPYTQENTKVVVWIYNRAKGVHTHEDVLNMAKALVAANDN
jgi:hypothetical protein